MHVYISFSSLRPSNQDIEVDAFGCILFCFSRRSTLINLFWCQHRSIQMACSRRKVREPPLTFLFREKNINKKIVMAKYDGAILGMDFSPVSLNPIWPFIFIFFRKIKMACKSFILWHFSATRALVLFLWFSDQIYFYNKLAYGPLRGPGLVWRLHKLNYEKRLSNQLKGNSRYKRKSSRWPKQVNCYCGPLWNW